CQISPSHHYLNSASTCPWCEIEGRSNTLLFLAVFVTGASGTDGFMLLWQQVTTIQLPDRRCEIPIPPTIPANPDAKQVGRRLRRASAIITAPTSAVGVALSQVLELVDPAQALVCLFAILALVLPGVRAWYRRAVNRQIRSTNNEWQAL